MTRVVVDTDVASFIFKNHPIGALYEADLTGCTPALSFMTLAELDRWAIQIQAGISALRMAAAVSRTIRGAALQPQAPHHVGGGDRGRAGARVPDRVCRRVDRRHGAAARRAAGDPRAISARHWLQTASSDGSPPSTACWTRFIASCRRRARAPVPDSPLLRFFSAPIFVFVLSSLGVTLRLGGLARDLPGFPKFPKPFRAPVRL